MTEFHNPLLASVGDAAHTGQVLHQSHPELVEAVVMLYDSRYSDAQFTAAVQQHFAPALAFEDPGLSLHGRNAVLAQFLYLRRWFSSFEPHELSVTSNSTVMVIDARVRWRLWSDRVVVDVHHLLRARVNDRQRVSYVEDCWSLNDRIRAALNVCGCYDALRWLISAPSTAFMKWRLGLQ